MAFRSCKHDTLSFQKSHVLVVVVQSLLSIHCLLGELQIIGNLRTQKLEKPSFEIGNSHYEVTGRFSRPLKTGIPVKWTGICQTRGSAFNRFSCSWNRNPVTSDSGIPVPQRLWQMWRSKRNSGSQSCSTALSAQAEFLYILQQDFQFRLGVHRSRIPVLEQRESL